MKTEIERKFLLKHDLLMNEVVKSTKIAQLGVGNQDAWFRLRIKGLQAYLTIKGKQTGITKMEYEYEIPCKDAEVMFNEFKQKIPYIQKTRHIIIHENVKWEIDEFHGENEGLWLAEVELNSEDEVINLPDWIGKEVSTDSRYLNSHLAKFPYKHWLPANK